MLQISEATVQSYAVYYDHSVGNFTYIQKCQIERQTEWTEQFYTDILVAYLDILRKLVCYLTVHQSRSKCTYMRNSIYIYIIL